MNTLFAVAAGLVLLTVPLVMLVVAGEIVRARQPLTAPLPVWAKAAFVAAIATFGSGFFLAAVALFAGAAE